MSQELINRNPDLKRLRDEGYEVEIRATYLLVHSIPYVNSRREICRATLISTLQLAGDQTANPSDHVTLFTGDHPCNKDGSEISQIKHSSPNQTLAPDIVARHLFSNKPPNGYSNYYEKMTRYAQIISAPAQSLDPGVSAKTHKVVESHGDESVFQYLDTASSRAGIKAIADKLVGPKLGIVGLGGTGSYILDLLAKTSVKEIHLFDGDVFYSHNAFRSPGAASIDDLRRAPKKVQYYCEIYGRMHKGIIAHDLFLNASNVEYLRGLSFVFLCLDKNEVKRPIVDYLELSGIPFIDVGMDVIALDDMQVLIGDIRVTTSTPEKRDHLKQRVSFADGAGGGEYERNIQIAELNALNAALAVVKWKKLMGFYQDLETEHHSTYSLNVNMLRSEDRVT
jgi:tRNA A37 threonylcarbamoyladenosine dehydratase